MVLERRDELFLHHFWLITNWTAAAMSGEDLLAMYRERDTAEGHMGELMEVPDPALSSSPRPKSHYRGKVPEKRFPSGDSFAHNEVLLLLNVLAYDIAHAARVMIETATKQGWSLRRLRERVSRVAGRVLVHERRAVLVIGRYSAALWHAICSRLSRLHLAPFAESWRLYLCRGSSSPSEIEADLCRDRPRSRRRAHRADDCGPDRPRPRPRPRPRRRRTALPADRRCSVSPTQP